MFVNPPSGNILLDEVLKRAIRIAPSLDKIKAKSILDNYQDSENW